MEVYTLDLLAPAKLTGLYVVSGGTHLRFVQTSCTIDQMMGGLPLRFIVPSRCID